MLTGSRKRSFRSAPIWFVALCVGLLPVLARAASLPPGFAETRIAQGLDPTALAIAPDGRLFLTEKPGRIRIVKDDVLLATPFATVTPDRDNEQGLLGIALDPNFASNGFVYVFYTVPGSSRRNRISRFTARGDVAAGGETVLFDLSPRNSWVHNGGGLAFGPDGKLYVSAGDDQSPNNAPSTTTLHGKILRLNADGSVPADNPNPTWSFPYNAIWALGLRNPFHIAFQPGTGRMYINEVGEAGWEEINEGAPNANYGWPGIEGPRASQPQPVNYRDPVHAYSHSEGCAVTGGAFYNPATVAFPIEYVDRYFFADYCGGYIKLLNPSTRAVSTFATGINRPLMVAVGRDGSLYYIARGGIGGGTFEDNTASNTGELYRVRYTASLAPTISAHPQNVTSSPGETATFIVGASGATPLSYQWQRNGVNISGATSQRYTTAPLSLADHGAQYRAVVSNALGSATSQAATLSVVANEPPMPRIDLPTGSTLYTAGTSLAFAGAAVDPEDGALPASALTWWIDFHHDDHTHPALTPVSGVASGSYLIGATVETSPNVWYRVYLRATDRQGRSTTIQRDVLPRKATFTLGTVPAGMGLLLDGQPVNTPVTVTGVVGVTRTLEAPATQTVGATSYAFSGWSDAGARSHTIQTPAASSSFVATYQAVSAGSGQGLRAEYFNNPSLSGAPALTQLESIDFNWGSGSPASGTLNADWFSVRWSGEIEAPVSGPYVFSTVSDDGIRMTIGTQRLIDNWTDHASTVDTASPITLTAGQRYPIIVEFYENGGGAEARLRWSYPGVETSAVPISRLFAPGSGPTPPPGPTVIRINFQPVSAPVPAGYIADAGLAFGAREGGYSFGWDSDVSITARDRNLHQDQRYDTLLHLQKEGNRRWEIALANGRYSFRIVAGDPQHTNQLNSLVLEGVMLNDPDGQDTFDEYSGTVTVTDGRLTLSPAAGAMNAKLCFIDLTWLSP
jgi:glucose/arabinose dehydrogenase